MKFTKDTFFSPFNLIQDSGHIVFINKQVSVFLISALKSGATGILCSSNVYNVFPGGVDQESFFIRCNVAKDKGCKKNTGVSAVETA